MVELPVGTVAFLFTDLESSTRLWEEQPEAMRVALARHDAILRDAIESHRGVVFSEMGDGMAAAFASPGDGVAACIDAQLGLAVCEWGPTGPLRPRMGLHVGEGELRADGQYVNQPLNRCARLMAVANGGQVLVSETVESLVRGGLPAGVGLVNLGEHRLRDLARPIGVFQVVHPALPGDFPPLRSLDALPGNLPLQVSSFVGRGRELARVAAALDEARVVTLTGVGGVGKTRLALQIAAEALPRFREGAWLCELAAVRDPHGTVGALAAVFGVTARAGQTLIGTLVDFLRTKQLLLVLDNCEHLLEAVAELVQLLEQSCAGVVVLATSREGLALEGERVLPVPSLPGPPADADLDTVARADAVQLFVERARGVDPDFGLTTENAGAVAQVCQRLDGVPLAIELAAARVGAMNPAELAAGLSRRFDTLAGGRRRAVQRHQTLRAAIDWSYDLLSEPERRLLARLAVFAGGCTRDAAEAVCGGAVVEPGRVFDLLVALVHRSLVVADRDRPETRYRLLETIREYGEDRLAEHDETAALRARHAEYYAELASRVSAEIVGPHQIEAGRRLIAEQENLLASVNYAIDTDNVDLALRLLHNTPYAGAQVGYELLLPVDPVLELSGASEHPLYAYGLARASLEAGRRGDLGSADELRAEALAEAQRLGDPDRLVENIAANIDVMLASSTGAMRDAGIHAERSMEIARSSGRRNVVIIQLASAATFYAMAGDADAAVPLATEGLALARRFGMPTLIVLNLAALAAALADQDPDRAKDLLRESIELRATLDYESYGEITQAVLISARLKAWPEALALAPSAIRHLHWSGERPLLGAMFNVVARALAPADARSAAVLQGAARQLTPSVPGVAAAAGGPVAAPHSPPAAPSGGSSSPTDFVTELRRETTGLLHDALGQPRLHQLRGEGAAMNTDDAVAYVLDAVTHSQNRAQE